MTAGAGSETRVLCPGTALLPQPPSSIAGTLTLTLDGEKTFNRILLQEYIPLGQRIAAFHINILTPEGTWQTIAEETTVGYKRIVLTEKVSATALRVAVDEALACPTLTRVALYCDSIF